MRHAALKVTQFTLTAPQLPNQPEHSGIGQAEPRRQKGLSVIRGILDHGSNGWRVELYDTEPLRRTIIEIDALPSWADASAVMSSAFRLVS